MNMWTFPEKYVDGYEIGEKGKACEIYSNPIRN